MFRTINSVISSVFGVDVAKSEAETQAMFDAANVAESRRRKVAPVAAVKPTKPTSKSQKAKARKAKGKARKAAAKLVESTRKPTVHTPHHHEPVTTVMQTNILDKLAATPAARTPNERRMIIEILHAAIGA